MKKILNFGIVSAFVLLQSCEEKVDGINWGPSNFLDTTYTAAIEAPQPRNVLIEEFTGASCTNCPAGHVAVASIEDANPDRVVAIAYHTFNGGGVFKPVHKPDANSKYDFRDSAATSISSTIFGGVNSIPVAGIDRMPQTGSTSLQLGRSQWPLQCTNRLALPSPANLYTTAKYNSANNIIEINVRVAYTQAVTTKNVLTIGVLESGIIDAQEYPSYIDTAYVHNHIFRKCLTQFNGNPVLDSLTTKAPGRVYAYNYSFSPAANWKLENCKIVTFLSTNESGNKEVLQAIEVKIE